MATSPPAHVNQLRAGGTFPSGPYKGQRSGPYDCGVATGIMALDAYTGGAIRPSISEFRSRQPDNDHNGIGLDDVAAAWRSYGLTFDHGAKLWPAITKRLATGDGLALQGRYGALGSWRAPGSKFVGPHSMWVQRATRGNAVVNDPLRDGPTVMPLSVLRGYYVAGAFQTGWGHGVYGGVPGHTGGGSWGDDTLAAWNGIVVFPVGHVITAGDVADIMQKLDAAGFFGKGLAEQQARGLYEGILNTAIGKPWTKALQDDLARRAAAAASAAGDPFGGITMAIGEGVTSILVNGVILVVVVGLGWAGVKRVLGGPSA